MKKPRLMVVLLLFLVTSVACFAQYDEEFEAFSRQQEEMYNDFKNKADEEFTTFLKENWKSYNAFAPEERPVKELPAEPEVFSKSDSLSMDADETKVELTCPANVRTQTDAGGDYLEDYLASLVANRGKHRPGYEFKVVNLYFYGNEFSVGADIQSVISLSSIAEEDIVSQWEKLCKSDYQSVIADLLIMKQQMHLNDWAYVLLCKQFARNLLGLNKKNEAEFLQMFILCQSGYLAKVARAGNQLVLLLSIKNKIYGKPHVQVNDRDFYIFGDVDPTQQLFTYAYDFEHSMKLVSLDLDQSINIGVNLSEMPFVSRKYDIAVNAAVNTNLIDFYKTYPQCDLSVYAKAVVSPEVIKSVLPTLREAIQGKSQREVVNILLNFVQTAFNYKRGESADTEMKSLFIDEVFYYPYTDSESSALLFSYLVKTLAGLSTVLLDYPKHTAVGVSFDEEQNGNFVMVGDKKFIICDPTFINAPVGVVSTRCKGTMAKVLQL